MPPATRPTQEENLKKALRLRPPSLLAACFLVLAAVALAYVAGVMSGRAYSRNHAPQTTQEAAARTGQAKGAAVADRLPQSSQALEEGAGAGQQVLAAEELHFARALRGQSGVPAQGAAPPAQEQAAPPAPQQVLSPAQAHVQPDAQVVGPASPASPAGAAQAPPQAPAPVMFDYIFQVAAFKDEDSVDALRQRLEGRGLRTRMQRDGKLFLVLVLLRGDAARAAEVPQIMEEMRLGQPMLRSRKAVL